MNKELREMEERAHALSRRISKLKANEQTLAALLEHVREEKHSYQEEFDDLVDKIYTMKWEKVGT